MANIGYMHPAFNSTGTFIAVGDQQGYINIWSAINGSLAAGPFFHNTNNARYWLTLVAYSSTGESIASANYDGIVKVWDIKTGIAQFAITIDNLAMSVSYSPNGTLLVSGIGSFKNSDKSIRTEYVEKAYVTQYSLDDKYTVVGRGNGEVVVQHAGSRIVAYGPYKLFEIHVGHITLLPNGKYPTVTGGQGSRGFECWICQWGRT
ncbi:hypothetical protein K439DRAFT_1616401 [Ramaria rubella]|nr:hypothetical protein K439DRAFT_1616401 [Ramaria rubella]